MTPSVIDSSGSWSFTYVWVVHAQPVLLLTDVLLQLFALISTNLSGTGLFHRRVTQGKGEVTQERYGVLVAGGGHLTGGGNNGKTT